MVRVRVRVQVRAGVEARVGVRVGLGVRGFDLQLGERHVLDDAVLLVEAADGGLLRTHVQRGRVGRLALQRAGQPAARVQLGDRLVEERLVRVGVGVRARTRVVVRVGTRVRVRVRVKGEGED